MGTGRRLSPSEAAAYIEREWHLRVSASTVRRWAEQGSLTAHRGPDGRLYVEPADLHGVFDTSGAAAPDDAITGSG